MSDRYAQRRQKLLSIVREQELDAMLVTSGPNVSWLTGFSGDSTWLLLGPKLCLLVSDSRYATQIAEECPGLEALIRKTDVKLHEAAAKGIRQAKIGRLSFEGHIVTCEMRELIGGFLKTTEWKSLPWRIENELRSIKDSGEVAEIRQAVHLAARGWDFLQATLTPEMSELQAAHEMEHAMRRFGAAGASFPPIVAVGDRAALPHYRPGRIRLEEGCLLLVDWGARTLSGYHSDLTRVLAQGKATSKLEKVYHVVLEAQLRAIRAIRPGAKCKDVDAAARQYIVDQGFGARFGHSLGHGIGLEIHEQPRLAQNSEMVLQAGMVVTVEPGIYLPRWGGVRIEDDVLVTAEGCEVLSAAVPKEWGQVLVTT